MQEITNCFCVSNGKNLLRKNVNEDKVMETKFGNGDERSSLSALNELQKERDRKRER